MTTRSAARTAAIAVVVVAAIGLVIGVYINQERVGRPDVPQAGPTYQVPTSTSFAVPADPRLLIVGDSYTAGTAAKPATSGWAYLVAKALGWPDRIDGTSGTGFSWGGADNGSGGGDYATRIATRARDRSFVPNVVILQGGQNDWRGTPQQVYDGTRSTIAEAKSAWPGVQVVVIGPSQPQPGGALLARVADPISRASNTEGAPFIDPIKLRWFTDQNSRQFSGDPNGTHPNTAGHRYLADRVLEQLRALGITTQNRGNS